MPNPAAAQNLPSETVYELAPDAKPANDARAEDPLPQFVLTDAKRAELDAQAARVPSSEVAPLPPYVEGRLRWMGGILATAWSDQDAMGLVPLSGSSPVTRDEIADFGCRIEYARELTMGREITSPNPLASLSDVALRNLSRGAQKTLCNALPVWFYDRPGKAAEHSRKVIREIREAELSRDVTPNTVKLLAIIDGDAGIEPWLRALPRGEGDALDTLRAEHPEWVRREQLATSKTQRPAPVDDRVLRAWALLGETLGRILQAGRYLTRSRSDRPRAYRAFARPAATRTRTPKKAPPRGDTQPTDGAPKVTPT